MEKTGRIPAKETQKVRDGRGERKEGGDGRHESFGWHIALHVEKRHRIYLLQYSVSLFCLLGCPQIWTCPSLLFLSRPGWTCTYACCNAVRLQVQAQGAVQHFFLKKGGHRRVRKICEKQEKRKKKRREGERAVGRKPGIVHEGVQGMEEECSIQQHHSRRREAEE